MIKNIEAALAPACSSSPWVVDLFHPADPLLDRVKRSKLIHAHVVHSSIEDDIKKALGSFTYPAEGQNRFQAMAHDSRDLFMSCRLLNRLKSLFDMIMSMIRPIFK